MLIDNGRLNQWIQYIPMLQRNIITGGGLNFVNTYSSSIGSIFDKLHCEYLQIIVEIGIVGLGFIAWMIWDLFTKKVNTTKESAIIRACLAGFCINALTLYPFHLWAISILIVFLYSSIYALKAEENVYANAC
jgi:O-antigen ligase